VVVAVSDSHAAQSLVSEPLSVRLARLGTLADGAASPSLVAVPALHTGPLTDESHLTTILSTALAQYDVHHNDNNRRKRHSRLMMTAYRGHEGLMIKDADAPYSPGARSFSWLKVRPATTETQPVIVDVDEDE
jgi:ATP-dependent DNA ligase